jgi:hypothetical protein
MLGVCFIQKFQNHKKYAVSRWLVAEIVFCIISKRSCQTRQRTDTGQWGHLKAIIQHLLLRSKGNFGGMRFMRVIVIVAVAADDAVVLMTASQQLKSG